MSTIKSIRRSVRTNKTTLLLGLLLLPSVFTYGVLWFTFYPG